MFSVRLHDVYMDSTFRADKSFFFFEDMVLCLGSGVSCSDRKHPVATTLFQDFKGAGKQKGEGLYEDASFAYVVKQGNVQLTKEGKRTIAYVDHGLAPKEGGYEYYMLKDKSAAASVVTESPVKVIRKDSAAHIVERDGVVCAALFDADVQFDGTLVESVNIPLAYILEDKGNGRYSLSLCEPDMRRASKLNMNNLTDKEVAEDSKPFETTLTLDGEFEVISVDYPVKVERTQGETMVTITTEKARNYTLQLMKL
jgi:chondroitin-sulfate-ABC endolyase/exolyase